MQITTPQFSANAKDALADKDLQMALAKLRAGFTARRGKATDRLPEFDALCDQARAIKDHVLANLDDYLVRFEAKVIECGGQVHWCVDAAEARDIVITLEEGASFDLRVLNAGQAYGRIAVTATLGKGASFHLGAAQLGGALHRRQLRFHRLEAALAVHRQGQQVLELNHQMLPAASYTVFSRHCRIRSLA